MNPPSVSVDAEARTTEWRSAHIRHEMRVQVSVETKRLSGTSAGGESTCRSLTRVGLLGRDSDFYFRFAAFADSLPSAVRVFFGSLLIVFLRLAAAAAFLTFLRAAARCFALAKSTSSCLRADVVPNRLRCAPYTRAR